MVQCFAECVKLKLFDFPKMNILKINLYTGIYFSNKMRLPIAGVER